jgi:photosystem II stability/assembly factor-like uncharacterized protein
MIIKTTIRKLVIALSLLALTGFGSTSARMGYLVNAERMGAVFLDESGTQQVYPLINPATVSCDLYWEAIPTVNGLPAFITLNVNSPAQSTNSAEWRPVIPENGLYRIEAYIPAPPSTTSCTQLSKATQNTSQAIYEVYHASGTTNVTLNQNATLNAWVPLGSFQFLAGDSGYIKLTDLNSETSLTRFIVFSAIRFIPDSKTHTIFLPRVSKEASSGGQTSSVVIRQRQAFDSCIRPSLSGMQTWWNSSPYFIYNIYMGGVSNSSCFPDTLTASWISSVHAQGWEFIPTWVGPQAPCTSFKFRFSYDPLNAFGEGVNEANLAFNRAVELGLVGSEIPRTVIYYDMESFSGGSTECRNAAKSFLNGWSQRLHELGARSGVYGSSCYYMPDWKNLSNPLDDAWLASWYKVDHDNNPDTDKEYFYDPYANVWSVLCSSSLTDAWTDHQRIRQYAGGHKETWGGVSVNIDSNITDGRVFSPSGASAPDVASDQIVFELTSSVNQTLGPFQLVAPESGWIYQEGRLRWTSDGGATWVDRTPDLPDAEFIAFHFKDVLSGWSLVRTIREDKGLTLLILRTTDGGLTWFTTTLPVSPENAFQGETAFFDFIDSSTGWLSLRLQSSSVFRPGLLFHTRDGGDTWQDMTIPVGEAVRFITSQLGWTAGGPAGDEFYMTRDGGLTWESAAFIHDGPGMVNYSLPEFSDPQNGILLVTIIEAEESRLEQYTTQDGGSTWQLVGLVPLGTQVQPGTAVPADTIDAEAVVAADSTSNLLYSSENAASQPLSLTSSGLPAGVVEIMFISPQEGWLKTFQSTCSGEKTVSRASEFFCSFNESLWKTVDGGLNWEKIR